MVFDILPTNVAAIPWEQDAARVHGIHVSHHSTVDGELMDRSPGLRVVSNVGVGMDHIDLAAANARGMPRVTVKVRRGDTVMTREAVEAYDAYACVVERSVR